ncbi:MAG: hypothetical protein ABJ042_00335, partial [Lentilitoribacter sp.]
MIWIKKSLLSGVFIVISSIVLLEIIGLFVFDNRYYWEQRYLSISQNSLTNKQIKTEDGENTIWTYYPNSEIRYFGVYADFFGAHVEYDCTFETNSLGFINTGPVNQSADYLVVGDSFTEGQGGCPWLTAAALNSDPNFAELSILNGGQQGAGILTFEKIIELHEQAVSIENLVIIAISNDFKRGDIFKWPLDGPCYIKLECGNQDYWHFVDRYIDSEQLLSQAKSRRIGRNNPISSEVIRYSFTYRLFNELTSLISQHVS